jgi:thiol-disulfide isomerase/thioredoxin
MTASASAPDALLFITSTCPHCAATADALLRLAKEARIGRLEIISLDVHPESAAAHQVRSVPWLRLGPFELTGGQSYAELLDWAEKAGTAAGWTDYALHLLRQQQLERVVSMVREEPRRLAALLELLADDDLDLGARIGISAVVEEFTGSEVLRSLRPVLAQLTFAESAQARADACHFLGLAGESAAGPAVRRLLDDDDAEVREIAMETLALLNLPVEGPSAGGPRSEEPLS